MGAISNYERNFRAFAISVPGDTDDRSEGSWKSMDGCVPVAYSFRREFAI